MKNLAFRQTKNLVLTLIIILVTLFAIFSIYQRNLLKEKLNIVFNYTFPTIQNIQDIETLTLKVQNVFNLYLNQKSITHLDIQKRINLNNNLVQTTFKDTKIIEEFEKLNLMFSYYVEQYKGDITGDSIDNIRELIYEQTNSLILIVQDNHNIQNQEFIIDNLKYIQKNIEEFNKYDINLLLTSIKQLEEQLTEYKDISLELKSLQSMALKYEELETSNSKSSKLTELKTEIILKLNLITKKINTINRKLKEEIDNNYKKIENSFENINMSIILMLIISILILIFSSYLLNKKIIEPINKLRNGIKKYLAGDKKYQIVIQNDKDFNYLASSINNMTKKINQNQKELYLLNEQLEEKVKDRTLKLYEKTKELKELNENLDKKVKSEISKRLEQEKMLAQQARLAAMGEMIGNIAHQWRQPLNTLNLLIQNIEVAHQFDEIDDEFMKRSVEKANTLTGRMSKTIDDFRNFFKPNKKMTNFILEEEVETALTLISGNLESNSINIEKEYIDNVVIYGYQNEFSQAILNIISNAKDVLINKKVDSPKISIKIYKKDNDGILEIEDNGEGIEEENITKIFDPYFTTKHKSEGTGIGLYMTKLIIENNMKGKLEVFNTNNGAIFRITIKEALKEK